MPRALPGEDLLADAELRPLGYLEGASNSTMLCRLGPAAGAAASSHGPVDAATDDEGPFAVYKPEVGERPLWDFPSGTLCRREVAARVVSDALGWDVVPPTVLRDGFAGIGSVQLFVPHDPREHYFVLISDAVHHEQLARMAVFDLLVNNADRKGSHVLLDDDGHLWGIDHGVCFHPQPKLRTVIWELGGWPVADAWRADLARVAEGAATRGSPLATKLCELLSPQEVALTARRAEALVRARRLPAVEESRRPYPWPPL